LEKKWRKKNFGIFNNLGYREAPEMGGFLTQKLGVGGKKKSPSKKGRTTGPKKTGDLNVGGGGPLFPGRV